MTRTLKECIVIGFCIPCMLCYVTTIFQYLAIVFALGMSVSCPGTLLVIIISWSSLVTRKYYSDIANFKRKIIVHCDNFDLKVKICIIVVGIDRLRCGHYRQKAMSVALLASKRLVHLVWTELRAYPGILCTG